MTSSPPAVVLGSRSPRRRELLELLLPAEHIVVKPPRSTSEAGFEGLSQAEDIARRLREIVGAKREDVEAQLTPAERAAGIAIVADTIIVVSEAEGSFLVLGQPAEPDWRPAVREWFVRFYSGRSHQAWTGICVWNRAGRLVDDIVKTAVTFREVTPEEIEWYLATGEPRGKAGGYALQGLASMFVERVDGSLTNVVGLPLEALRTVLG